MPHGWDNFLITAGTSAATLMGLLFVVITLGAQMSDGRAQGGIHAFVTPTLVHFGGILFQSMILLAQWPSRWVPAVAMLLCGLAGSSYAIVVTRMLRRLDFVALDLRDWAAYAGAPGLANAGLIAGGAGLAADQAFAPYAIACAILLLLLIGIHDAWDLSLWIVRNRSRAHD